MCRGSSFPYFFNGSSIWGFYHFPLPKLAISKNRGGLVQASYGAFKVVEHCEKAFKLNVLEGGNKAITSKPHLVRKMIVQVLAVCDWGNFFPNITRLLGRSCHPTCQDKINEILDHPTSDICKKIHKTSYQQKHSKYLSQNEQIGPFQKILARNFNFVNIVD